MKRLLLSFAILLLPVTVFAQTPLPEPAKVLARYVGNWELTLSNLPNATIIERFEWVMNGSFVRKSVSPTNDPGPMAMTSIAMLQYDKAKTVYHQWTFSPAGGFESEGSWDPVSKTLTWTARDATRNVTTVSKWILIDADTDEIKMITTDSAGKVIEEKTGRRKRKK